jgi:hypothetical protein
MKQVLVVILFCAAATLQPAYAQTVLFAESVHMKRSAWTWQDREAFPVQNEADSSLSLFLIDRNSVQGLLFNKSMELSDTLHAEKPGSGPAMHRILGASQGDGVYTLYLTSRDHRDLSTLTFDYARRDVQRHTLSLPLEKERFIGAIGYRGKLYMFTTVKGSSKLNLYGITPAGQYEVHSYDFTGSAFTPTKGRDRLDDVFRAQSETVLTAIDHEVPNDIELTSQVNKLYTQDHQLIITLDNELYQTWVITIDLNTYQEVLKYYDQGKIHCGAAINASSASYIHSGVLYQMKGCPGEMVVRLTSLAKGEILQEYRIQDTEEKIAFMNTPFVQVKTLGKNEKEKELNTSRQFLRKLSKGKGGLSAYTTAAGVELAIGSYQAESKGSGTFMSLPTGGGSIMTPGGAVTLPVSYYPTYSGFVSSKASRSVYFKTLLHPIDYTHKAGDLQKTGFEEMADFSRTLGDKSVAETVFKKGNYYVLGYYLKSKDQYVMRRFSH